MTLQAWLQRTGSLPGWHLLGTILSIGGWAIGLSMWLLETGGQLHPGIDLLAYVRAADDLLAGHPVYVGQIGDATNFPYAPTWAVLFAALAWVPPLVLQLAIIALDFAALRYVTGSWRAAGWVFWFPVVMFEINAGNIHLLIAAALVMSARGRIEPLVFVGLAKIAPLLAIPPREWRRALLVLGACVAVTLPWLHLWPEWVAYLLRQPAMIPMSLAVPWYLRLPVALALIATRRPWAIALGAVVAMPSMYLSTLILLLAPIRIFVDGRTAARAGAQAESHRVQPAGVVSGPATV